MHPLDRRLAQRPPKTWIGEITAQHAELGDLQQFSLLRFEVNTQYRGRLYIFDYATTYSKQSATETVTLSEDHDGKTITIVAHGVSL